MGGKRRAAPPMQSPASSFAEALPLVSLVRGGALPGVPMRVPEHPWPSRGPASARGAGCPKPRKCKFLHRPRPLAGELEDIPACRAGLWLSLGRSLHPAWSWRQA